MNKSTSNDKEPMMISVDELSVLFGISRSGAYQLAKSKGFPSITIGRRIFILRDRLQEWLDAQFEHKD